MTKSLSSAWNFAEGWNPWLRRIVCPLVIAPLIHFLCLFVACVLTNFYWFNFKIDINFWIGVSLYSIVGFSAMFRSWRVVWIAWLCLASIALVVTTAGYDLKSWILSILALPVGVSIAVLAVQPVNPSRQAD